MTGSTRGLGVWRDNKLSSHDFCHFKIIPPISNQTHKRFPAVQFVGLDYSVFNVNSVSKVSDIKEIDRLFLGRRIFSILHFTQQGSQVMDTFS